MKTTIVGRWLLLGWLTAGWPLAGQVVITHQTEPVYVAGGRILVTNQFTGSDPLWSLLWRPLLPAGWTVVAVTGPGSPEYQYGEIVWTGALSNSVPMIYEIAVPTNATGRQTLRGEVEYQTAGMINPVTAYANPDPMILNAVGPHTLSVFSTNAADGVTITVSPVDANGASNGVTAFTRSFSNPTQVQLTAPVWAGTQCFGGWLVDGVLETNCLLTLTMNADHVVWAQYVPAPILGSCAKGQGPFAFDITGQVGERYEVYRSQDLHLWTPWQTLTNATGTIRVTDGEPSAAGLQFYRVWIAQ